MQNNIHFGAKIKRVKMEKKIFLILLILTYFCKIGFSQNNVVNSPIENFEKLWNKFNNRYANFGLKKVDWNQIHQEYRKLVNENTTNKELFETCCLMLQELNDGHVTIIPNFKEEDVECGPPYKFSLELEFDTDEKFHQFEFVMDVELTRNGFAPPIKKNLSEGTNFKYRLSDSLGYLRLDEMTEKNTFGGFKRAVDEAVKKFQSKEGLIIDLRFNGGGWDHSAYKLASRFVPNGKTIGHFERTRIKGTDEYTKMKYKEVKSKGKLQFTKPIVILTSDFTASAAEVFIMLMNELPNVTLVGDKTEGIFSDMYEFKLPNKWDITLSHQQFFSQNKENFEGKGIVPDILVVNSEVDIENQGDPVIQTAINYLLENNH